MRAPGNPRGINPIATTAMATAAMPTTVAQVVDQWRDISAIPGEFEAFGRAMTSMAADLGLSPAELRALAAKDANARQLASLLEALRIDVLALAERAPATLKDLRRACTVCDQKSRCDRDIAARTQLARHQAYCTNATMLRKLRQDGDFTCTNDTATLQPDLKPGR